MVEMMSVSRGTVLRKAHEYQLKPSWTVKHKEKNKLSLRIESRQKRERKKFINYRKKYPGRSRSEIRQSINSTYKFLSRHDREWLDSHLPPVKQAAPRRIRADWTKRDSAYLTEVKNIVSELLSIPGKPIRITPSVISKIMGKKNLFTKIDPAKIPRTMAYLKEACHQNHHHKRRLLWARDEIKKKGKTITRSNLIYTACLSYNLTDFQEEFIKHLVAAGYEKSFNPVTDCPHQT